LIVAAEQTVEVARDYPFNPVPFTDVRIADGFWAPRIETNRKVSIPYAFAKCEENGRMSNFAIAGGLAEGEHQGRYPFDDTDPYKILEGASYALAVRGNPALEKYLDDLIALIAAAQEDDGYIFTSGTNKSRELAHRRGKERWEKLLQGSHELYNVGHLTEAAVAHYQATGKRSLLDVAIKAADLAVDVFGPGKKRVPPGHQIIEMALARLYRVTGNQAYLQLAKFFLDVRGRPLDGRGLHGPYNQDHAPPIEQDEAVGHAVRAAYMYAGMVDVAALTGDAGYVEAIDRLWDNVVSRKLHLTGGIGARGDGEAFGDDYELPNLTAYNETCASIGNVYWNHRLFLLHGNGKYIDVMERSLYNALIAGVSLDGEHFFYPNPLESRGQHARSPWFGCACCPGNVTRFMASVSGYAYAHRGDDLYVNLFVAGKGEIKTAGRTVRITQETDYPWDGAVRIKIEPEAEGDEFTVNIRIPGWARNEAVPSDLYAFDRPTDEQATLKINGSPVEWKLEAGFAPIRHPWRKGDVIELDLPMPIRRVLCNEKVSDNHGKVALQRGPLVYCAEWPDNDDGHVLNLLLEEKAELQGEHRPDLLGGVTVITGEATALYHTDREAAVEERPTPLVAIPYYAWAHRGKGEMTVWLPRDRAAGRPLGAPTVASRSTATASAGSDPGVLTSDFIIGPTDSRDQANPYFHWWPQTGSAEWVQYDFAKAETVSQTSVYWFDDTGRGACRLPKSWRVLYRDEREWKPVENAGPYGVLLDAYNTVTFGAVTTDAIRLEVQLQDDFAAGIHEWRVE